MVLKNFIVGNICNYDLVIFVKNYLILINEIYWNFILVKKKLLYIS